MDSHDLRSECGRRFDILEDRVDHIDEALNVQNVDVAVIKSQLSGLICSIDGLRKGIWGLVLTVITMIIGIVLERVLGG